MVKSTAELSALLQTYPWYAPARAALCVAVMQEGGPDAARLFFKQALPYLPDAAYIASKLQKENKEDYADADLAEIMKKTVRQKARIVVAGGDFFSRDDYDSVRSIQDAALHKIAVVDYSAPLADNAGEAQPEKEFWGDGTTVETIPDIVTETLAEIFINQGYPDRAIDIYTKLSLHYPEKSAYFATLIEKLRN